MRSIRGNSTQSDGGGAILNASGATATVLDSSLSDNVGREFGGGIYNRGGHVQVERTDFLNNRNLSNFGGGGGIYQENGTLTIVDSSFIGNSGPYGGGLYLAAGTVEINRSTFSGNVSNEGSGGAILNSAVTNLTNSTLSGNSVGDPDFDAGNGGAISNGGTLNIVSCTIANNAARSAGGVRNTGVLNARNTIFANNVSTTSGYLDFSGTLTSGGYNLIESTVATTITGITTGNILGQDPGLFPLGSYGGRTKTAPPSATSPALDAGDPTNSPATDQRGVARPKDGDLNGPAVPDIGAYERNPEVFTVTKTNDTADGTCDSDCSIREAVTAANAATGIDAVIEFELTGPATMSLTAGELQVLPNGATIAFTASFFDGVVLNGAGNSRVISVAADAALTLKGVRITGGSVPGGDGGGIRNFGSLYLNEVRIDASASNQGGAVYNSPGRALVIRNSTLSGNNAAVSGGAVYNGANSVVEIVDSVVESNGTAGNGGAISNAGTLVFTRTSLLSNSALNGGGFYSVSGSASTVTDSMITGNSAESGGGVYNTQGTFTINSSTLNGNAADADNNGSGSGGGIYNANSAAVLTLTNVTITDNTADVGGGVHNDLGAFAEVTNVTVSGNTARQGGGVNNQSGTVRSKSAIYADNIATSATAPDFFGDLYSLGNNLLESSHSTVFTNGASGHVTGQDPRLGPLRDNGGPTLTRALLNGSPAIDRGSTQPLPLFDQRGVSRPRDGDGDGTARHDIGAFELRAVNVTNINDSGPGSLRQAIIDATAGAEAVTFNLGTFNTPRTILLTSGELLIPANVRLTITGRGADRVTISGNGQSRVLYIQDGAEATVGGVTLTRGNGMGMGSNGFGGAVLNLGSLNLLESVVRNNSGANGGAIRNEGALSVVKTTITDNSVSGDGGGIINAGIESLSEIIDSTLSRNAASSGGAIFNFGTLKLTNSTVSHNSALLFGGGVLNIDTLGPATSTFEFSTIGYNKAGTSGGGINNVGGVSSLRNSIVANNYTFDAAPDFKGTLTSNGYNLIEDPSGANIVGDQTGLIVDRDPGLDPALRLNGGLTRTHALKAQGFALDKGIAVSPSITADQRGLSRPVDIATIANAPGGNGSDLGAYERRTTDLAVGIPFDYDGDGRADLSVRRPSDNVWHLLRATAGYTAMQFGETGDRMTPSDYDGDGKTDVSVFRPLTGQWFMFMSQSQTFQAFGWGQNGDLPVPTDRDSDGKTDLVIFRPSNNTWYTRFANGTFHTFTFGEAGDKPVVGDFDADGVGDIALFRPSNNNWYIIKSSLGFFIQTWGEPGDLPLTGDFDGDGATDQAAFRPSTGQWYLSQTTEGFSVRNWGENGDVPVAADYDGDGKTDVAVFRPSTSTWYIVNSTAGILIQQFGENGDVPTQSAFNY